MLINLHKIFTSCSWRNTNLKYCNKIWQLIKYFFCNLWRNADIIMCHGYRLDSLNWCWLSLPCFYCENLVCWWQIFEVLQLQPQKNVGIVGISHVRAIQCSSTSSLWEGWVFGSRDAWSHVPMLRSADTISIFQQRTKLSSPSKQGSNWQHQLRLSSL